MKFQIKTRRDHTEPAIYAISSADGSAYYLVDDALIQVPLDTEGDPIWESLDDPDFYGGGEVDFLRGFENVGDLARVKKIEAALTAAREVTLLIEWDGGFEVVGSWDEAERFIADKYREWADKPQQSEFLVRLNSDKLLGAVEANI